MNQTDRGTDGQKDQEREIEIMLLELQLEKIILETLFPSSRGLKSNLEKK